MLNGTRHNGTRAAEDSRHYERTDGQLWIEVLAVLCLAYVPALFNALTAISTGQSTNDYSANGMMYWMVHALRVSALLLVIMALSKDRWALFGIVRPKWGTDLLVGLLVFGFAFVSHYLLFSLRAMAYVGRNFCNAAHRAMADGPLAALWCCRRLYWARLPKSWSIAGI